MVERRGPTGGWRYRYDGFGRLAEAEDASGRRLTFGYDPLGRRIWKRDAHYGRETVTRFVWAGEQVVREVREGDGVWGRSGDDGPTARDYLYWPQTFTPLLLREGDSVYRYHTDGNGVPRRLLAAGGEVVWEADVLAFGEARVLTSKVPQPWRLPGQYHDEETGLHYNRHRYYDPTLGRYISRDPIGVAGGLNLYLYAGNDPVNRADPLGLWWKTALSVVAAAAAAVVVVALAPVTAPLALVVLGAGAAAGAAGFMANEALHQEEFCLRCILLEGAKGAVVGAVAAVPFVFGGGAGLLGLAGLGAGSGLLGYSAEVALTPGATWNYNDAGKSMAFGAFMGPVGRLIGSRLPIRRPYRHMQDPKTVKPGGDFTRTQKRKILEENTRRNGGRLRSDETGEQLVMPQQSRRGVTPPRNEAAVDHIQPKNPANPNATPGANSYGNARVITRQSNQEKSNKPPRNNRNLPAPPLPPPERD